MDYNNQYSEYIDNEEICKLQGIPCKYGIPDCSNCRVTDTNNNISEKE